MNQRKCEQLETYEYDVDIVPRRQRAVLAKIFNHLNDTLAITAENIIH